MVGGLEADGLLDAIVGLLEGLARIPLNWFGELLMWIVAGIFAIDDNVPITIASIPVIQGLGEAGMDIKPLWWALAFDASFKCNGTIISCIANIIVASPSEKTRTPITSRLRKHHGFPVMLVTCAIASILFVLLYMLF